MCVEIHARSHCVGGVRGAHGDDFYPRVGIVSKNAIWDVGVFACLDDVASTRPAVTTIIGTTTAALR